VRPARPAWGFTLAEVLAATCIGAFVALVAIGALRSTSTGASVVQDRTDRAAELRATARRIAMDLANIRRSDDANEVRLQGGVEDSGSSEQAYITFWAISHEKARPDQPEGDVYEVEYYLGQKEDRTLLMRRVWPHPDPNSVEPGGILTVLSDQIEMMRITYFDGEKWVSQWLGGAGASEQTDQPLPMLIEVTLVAKASEAGALTEESFLVTVTPSAVAEQTANLEAAQQSGSTTTGTSSSTTQGTTGTTPSPGG
jgi:type II secretion system protein J